MSDSVGYETMNSSAIYDNVMIYLSTIYLTYIDLSLLVVIEFVGFHYP